MQSIFISARPWVIVGMPRYNGRFFPTETTAIDTNSVLLNPKIRSKVILTCAKSQIKAYPGFGSSLTNLLFLGVDDKSRDIAGIENLL